MMILGPFLLLILAVTFSQGQETGFCSLVARCNIHGDNNPVIAGPRGPVGKAGPKGERGFRGQKGDEGTVGPKGYRGIIGPKGEKGSRGRKGDCRQEGNVNYTAVEEMIATAVSKVYQRLSSISLVEAMYTTDEDGWMVFQRRQDGSVDFYRTWTEYVNGFGDASGEFWMGLEKLHRLTSNGNYELRIDLEDWEGNSAYAQYSEFSVGSASTNYRLTVSGYSGTAGDSLINARHPHNIHNGMAFTTKDSDHDLSSSLNCAQAYKGGWWYKRCYEANLNGVYHRGGRSGADNGIVWYKWKKDFWYSMKFVEMKLRPVQ